jgi:hypothetical protein
VIASPSSPVASDSFTNLYLQLVLVKVDSSARLERVRRYLETHAVDSLGGIAPRTFGEAVRARERVAATVQRLVDIAVLLTPLVAGCSLAVTVGGGWSSATKMLNAALVVTGRFPACSPRGSRGAWVEMLCGQYQSAVASPGPAGPLGLTASSASSERKAS